VIVFPNCKINLGLNILAKRSDGYHDLETVFYPIGITDALEIIALQNAEQEIEFSTSGLQLNTKTASNLCIKAFDLLKQFFPQIPAVKIHLHKAIPIGGGLGGGSSDAAFTLRLLNEKFNLRLSTESLLDFAMRLGSDCPFFVVNKPCFASGRGEFLERLKVDLSGYKLVIVNPGVHIDTAEAFSLVTPAIIHDQ